MGKVCRRNSLFFFAGLLALCAIAVIIFALVSEEWVHCKIMRTPPTENGTTQETFDAGWKQFGLIRGCEKILPTNTKSERVKCFKGIYQGWTGYGSWEQFIKDDDRARSIINTQMTLLNCMRLLCQIKSP